MRAKANSAASSKVQEAISQVDIDIVGAVSLADVKGSRLEKDALKLLPEALSIVVFAAEVYSEILSHIQPQRTTGAASLNDLFDRHVDYLNSQANRVAYNVAKVSRRNGLKAIPLIAASIDARFLEPVLSYKQAALAAGLGYLGYSSLLITPDFGPRVRLCVCLTEATLETSKLGVGVRDCEGCELCIQSCPAKALSVPQTGEAYQINKFACSVYRNTSGGCAECLRVCPSGKINQDRF